MRPPSPPVSRSVPQDLVRRIQALPLDVVLRIRLEPLVETAFRGPVSQVHAQLQDATSRALIALALDKTGGHLLQAAQLLGLGRNTLARKARDFGLLDPLPRARGARRGRRRT